jgi:hypothetical protein
MKKIFYFSLIAIVIILSATGFSAPFTATRSMTGYPLLLHAALAPVFSLGVAMWVVLSASRNRFTAQDGAWLLSRFGFHSNVASGSFSLSLFARKVCFWAASGMAIVVILSIVLNMFPLFSMNWQAPLLSLHRFCTAFLTMGILGYMGFSFAIRNK